LLVCNRISFMSIEGEPGERNKNIEKPRQKIDIENNKEKGSSDLDLTKEQTEEELEFTLWEDETFCEDGVW